MKKYSRIAFIVLIVVICVLVAVIYTNASSKGNQKKENEKTYSEILYVESKIVELFNSMNNIEVRNYNISVEEISKKSQENNNQEEASSQSSSGGSNGSSGMASGGGQEQQGGTGSQNSESGSDNVQDAEKYQMEPTGILINDDEINWKYIKNQIENLYLTIPTFTIDLYTIDVNGDDILSFNKEFDNLTKSINDENKLESLKQLSLIYNYLPGFLQKTDQDEFKIKILDVKSNIFKGYSKLDENKWSEISEDINNAINLYSQILTSGNIDSDMQNSVSKVYVMINELQNAVEMKDTSIFLIKYKNLIEEIDNL